MGNTDALPNFDIVQQQTRPNDRNGNPRRVWVTWNKRGLITRVWDEGYRGRDPLASLDGVIELTPVEITAAEYRDVLSHAKSKSVFFPS